MYLYVSSVANANISTDEWYSNTLFKGGNWWVASVDKVGLDGKKKAEEEEDGEREGGGG